MQNSKKSGIPVNGYGSCKANDVIPGTEYEDKYIYYGLHFATIKQEIPSLKVKCTSPKMGIRSVHINERQKLSYNPYYNIVFARSISEIHISVVVAVLGIEPFASKY